MTHDSIWWDRADTCQIKGASVISEVWHLDRGHLAPSAAGVLSASLTKDVPICLPVVLTWFFWILYLPQSVSSFKFFFFLPSLRHVSVREKDPLNVAVDAALIVSCHSGFCFCFVFYRLKSSFKVVLAPSDVPSLSVILRKTRGKSAYLFLDGKVCDITEHSYACEGTSSIRLLWLFDPC